MLKHKLVYLIPFVFIVTIGIMVSKSNQSVIRSNDIIKRSLEYGKKNYNHFSKLMIKDGLSYQKKGQNEKAIDYFNRALQFDLKNAEAYYFKGVSLFNLKKLGQALKCFEKATELNPTYSDAIYYRDMTLNELLRNNSAY